MARNRLIICACVWILFVFFSGDSLPLRGITDTYAAEKEFDRRFDLNAPPSLSRGERLRLKTTFARTYDEFAARFGYGARVRVRILNDEEFGAAVREIFGFAHSDYQGLAYATSNEIVLSESATPPVWRHELFHIVSGAKAPRWLEEGMAEYFKHGPLRRRILVWESSVVRRPIRDLEGLTRWDYRSSEDRYRDALNAVVFLSAHRGEESLVRFVRGVRRGGDAGEVFAEIFGFPLPGPSSYR